MNLPQSPKLRTDTADIKVVGLGLGRTGTMSLAAALEILGFGPCYHPMLVPKERARDDWVAWADIAEGNSTPEYFDNILRGYHSVVDSPVAIVAPEVFVAYPNAKYILTIRDPKSWEKSIHETTLMAWNHTQDPAMLSPEIRSVFQWGKSYFEGYHHNRLETHAQQELLDHNKRIQELLPADQLLIFEVSEGWTKLANFLGVEIPSKPFPWLNEGVLFKQKVLRPLMEVGSSQAQKH